MDASATRADTGRREGLGRLGFKAGSSLVFAVLLWFPGLGAAQSQPELQPQPDRQDQPDLQVHLENFDEVAAAAAAARDRGDLPRAIELFQQAVQLHPKWPDGWWYLGSLEYNTNAYGSAIDALTHYIELTPGAGPAMALRGLCEFEQRQYSESLQDLEHGTALGAAAQPRNTAIIVDHEALLLTHLGKFEEALGKYAVLVKHGAVNDSLIQGIGLAGLRMPIFPQDITPSQQQMVLLVGRAAAAVMSGEMTTGQQLFDAVFHGFPSTPYVHYLYGYLLFPTDPGQAIAQFQQELAVSPSSAIVHSMLAWVYNSEGEYTDALPDARAAVIDDPSLPIAQLVLGRDLIETGNVQDGMSLLEGVLKTDPKNLEAHLGLVRAYSMLGRRDDAGRERLLCLALADKRASNANM
jgi:tetratricopeptide (TPR) repeat protein